MVQKNFKFTIVFVINVFLLTMYTSFLSSSQMSTPLIWQVLGFLMNIVLGIMLIKTVLDKVTIYYSFLLLSIIYMFIFIGSPVPILHSFSITIVSYLPALTLYFFILFFQGQHTKLSNLFLSSQILISFIRDTLMFLSDSYNQLSNLFFFLGIITFYLFSTYLYKKESVKHSFLTTLQKRKLLIGAIISFVPFIAASLIPAVLFFNGSLINHWSLSFFLALPLVVADILTEENLIYHQYWKTSLIQNFIAFSLMLASLVLMIGYIFSFSFVELILLGYLLLLFFFTSYIIFQLYNEKKKTTVINELLTFPLERQFFTQQFLQTQYIDSIKSFIFTSLSQRIALIDIDIIHKDRLSESDIKNGFKQSPAYAQYTRDVLNAMEKSKDQIAFLTISGYYYLFLNIDDYRSYLAIKKDEEFLPEDIEIMNEIQPVIHQLFISASNLSVSISNQRDTFYTEYEKSVFLSEVDLSDKYQAMIAHYLHDEVLQPVLSIRQSAYQKDSAVAIRETIEHAVEEIEGSIRKKMIEWEASDIPNVSLKESIGVLNQKLVAMYDRAIFIDINIPDSLDLPVSFQQFLFRSIRELLVNVYKHSNATLVKINLEIAPTTIQLSVKDNGGGDHMTIDFKSKYTNNYGLYSIYQHTYALNGDMSLFDNDNGGLSILLSYPTEAVMKGFS